MPLLARFISPVILNHIGEIMTISNQSNQQKATKFTVPGMDETSADRAIATLDNRMVALLDLALTLKHVHWNVVGPNFIGVHEMLDPQVEAVRDMTDTIAERIATLGGSPVGTPQSIADRRTWHDYSLGKALVIEHLGALDLVYNGVNSDHRKAIGEMAELDPVSEDMLIGQLTDLEQFQWFIRAHLESSDGDLLTANSQTELAAAKSALS
jgi:starvation-inducible DNA-binding protein